MAGIASRTVEGTDARGRVTITDVAAALGLAKGTVSRALNDYPDIAEGTRLKVRRMAERMGYRPLSHAQAIRTGRLRSLGLVLQVNEHDGHRPFLADFLAGVSGAASERGWTMTVATARSEAEGQAMLASLTEERKADGFILPRTYLADPRIAYLRRMGVPFVLYGRTGDPTGCAWYDIEGEAAMVDAVRRLAALGHRRIAFVPGGEGYAFADLRLKGYRAGLAAVDLPHDPALEGQGARSAEEGEQSALELLQLSNPPTAIVAAVDVAALGAYRAAASLGLSIGSDLSVIGYDGIPEGSYVMPQLSTYEVDNDRVGARLAEFLIRRIEGAAPEGLRALGQATFRDRGSIGPAPGTN